MVAKSTVAIQGELGSNSHVAAMALLGTDAAIQPCRLAGDVIAAVTDGKVDAAVLPIENSLHGSVTEHYDLLLEAAIRIDAELLLRIEHHLIAAPGVALSDVRHVLSHPVALSQCRNFLSGFSQARAQPFYDTAGSVRHLMTENLRDTAGLAPRLAAELYGAEILLKNVEDHRENLTRFHLLHRQGSPAEPAGPPDKLTAVFSIEHRPGTLVAVLQELAATGVDLTKIESRPVPGRPWEYIFFVDLRFPQGDAGAGAALAALQRSALTVKELGRYRAA